MLTADFDYTLPPERIAQEAAARGESRLLCLDGGGPARHRQVRDLPRLLTPGDVVVVNDTRVIPARLYGRGPGGGKIELLLVEKSGDDRWICLARPGRRARTGATVEIEGGPRTELVAEVVAELAGGRREVRFDRPLEGLLDQIGHVPLPPYIRRPDRRADRERYQTVYARSPGAIAAPTAGLHFDQSLLDELERAGIEIHALTLHVGIGTFKPVTAERVEEHRMESERYEIGAELCEALAAARSDGRRTVAVGTTVVRALEAAAREGGGVVSPGVRRTNLFITPGFRFRAVDLLLTNFHLPRSTLLMLVCAFAGRERVLAAYDEAVRQRYRFYSYGDAMLASRQGR